MKLRFPKLLTVPLLATAAILLSAEPGDADRGRGRGVGRGNGPEIPPGHARKVDAVTVPEPGTLTLLAVGLGGGLLVRRWSSRKPQP